MDEVSSDLIRLCTLLHRKNELQAQRHTARHRERKFKDIINNKHLLAKKKELEKVADVDKNPEMKKIHQIEAISRTMLIQARMNMSQGINLTKQSIMSHVHMAKGELKDREYALNGAKVAAKWSKIKVAELKILMRTAHIANEQAKLDIALFTKAHRKEIAQLCKHNNWRVSIETQNHYYNGVMNNKVEIVGNRESHDCTWVVKSREGIKTIAATQMLEDAICG